MDEAPPATESARSGLRSFLQFRLRTLFCVIAVIAAGLAFVPGYRQQKAVAALRRSVQVKVIHDYADGVQHPFAPDWLIDLVGIDYLADVVELEVNDAPPDNPDGDLWVYAAGPRKVDSFNRALRPLEGLTQLRRLKIESQELTDKGLAHLGNLGRLESLHLTGGQVSGAGLERLQALRQLKLECDVSHDCFRHLLGLRRLESLEVYVGQFTNEDLENLLRLPALRELELHGVSDEHVPCIARLANLESLGMRHSRISGGSLRHLASLNRLKRLDLSMCLRCGSGVHYLANLRSLESLELVYAQCSPEGLLAVSTLANLQRLDLRGNAVDGEDLRRIATLSELRELRLGGITDEHLVHLHKLQKLETLDVFGCDVTDEGISGLRCMPILKTLSVNGYSVSEDAALQLEASLPNIRVERLFGHP